MSNKLPSHGTLLSIKLSGTFTPIGNRAEIGDTGGDITERDITDLDSAMVTTRPAIPDPGTLDVTLFFDPNDTTIALLRARYLVPSQTLDEFKLTYNDGNTTPAFDDFKGWVKSFKTTGGGPMDTVKASMSIRISDQFTTNVGVP